MLLNDKRQQQQQHRNYRKLNLTRQQKCHCALLELATFSASNVYVSSVCPQSQLVNKRAFENDTLQS